MPRSKRALAGVSPGWDGIRDARPESNYSVVSMTWRTWEASLVSAKRPSRYAPHTPRQKLIAGALRGSSKISHLPLEPVEQREHRPPADPAPALRPQHEELGHPEVHPRLQVGRRGVVDEREADPPAVLDDDQRVIGVLLEPARQVVRAPEAPLVQRVVGVVERGEVVEIERIDVDQPLPVEQRATRIAQLTRMAQGAIGLVRRASARMRSASSTRRSRAPTSAAAAASTRATYAAWLP